MPAFQPSATELFRSPLNSRLWNRHRLPQNVTSAPSLTVLLGNAWILIS